MTDAQKMALINATLGCLQHCKNNEGNYNHEAMCFITDLLQFSEWCLELLNDKIARSES